MPLRPRQDWFGAGLTVGVDRTLVMADGAETVFGPIQCD